MKSFTIIIPSFNAENEIKHCLDSIIDLNYEKKAIKVYVIDDGSTDNTESIVNLYISKYQYINFIKKTNNQWGSVINYAKHHKLVQSDLVLILDADDKLHNESLNNVNKKIKNADVFFGSYQKWNGVSNKSIIFPFFYLFKRSTKNEMKMRTPVSIPLVVFFKKELFYKLKDLSEGVAYQDSFLISQLVNLSNCIRWTTKVTGYYFYNRQNNSMSERWTDKRFEAELLACTNCLSVNNQEFISYKFNVKEFRKIYKHKKQTIDINRKFNFSWFPFYIRWAYFLLHLLICRKYFRLKKNKI